MLVRMHHLILAEEPDLQLSDILLATSFPATSIPLNESKTTHFFEPTDPFFNFIPTLVHVPHLYYELFLVVCNKWNELLNTYNGSGYNSEVNYQQGLTQFAVLIFISLVTVIVDFCKDFSSVKDDSMKYFLNLCRRERERKNLSIKRLVDSTMVSLHPRNVIESTFNLIVWVVTTWFFVLPIMWYKEFLAIFRYLLDPSKYTLCGPPVYVSKYPQHI